MKVFILMGKVYYSKFIDEITNRYICSIDKIFLIRTLIMLTWWAR